jgi:hypothetical protein
MFEVLTQALQVVLAVAVLVMFFGLIARSDIRAARILGWFSVAWAVTVVIVEAYGWYDKGDWIIMPAKQLWYQIDSGSLNDFETGLARHFPTAIGTASSWVLSWPAWLVLSISGILLLIYDHIQLQRMHKGAPPPPLWKRIYRTIREAANPSQEQA